MDVRRVPTWLLAVLLVAGCAGGGGEAAGIPTAPETALPPPPPPLRTEQSAQAAPTPVPRPSTTPTATAPPPEAPAPTAPADVQADPEALGRDIGVAGMVELLAEDPELAGDRGRDLLQELQRIAEGRGRVDRRIEELYERIPRWVEDGDLDPQIATASLAALEVAYAASPRGDDDDDDDDD